MDTMTHHPLTVDSLALSRELGVTHAFVTNIAVNVLCIEPKREVCQLNQRAADIITLCTDPQFMRVFMKESRPVKGAPVPRRAALEVESRIYEITLCRDLNGHSTAEVGFMTGCKVSTQTVAKVLKQAGYTSQMVVLDSGKQGRRWFKHDQVDKLESARQRMNVSFI